MQSIRQSLTTCLIIVITLPLTCFAENAALINSHTVLQEHRNNLPAVNIAGTYNVRSEPNNSSWGSESGPFTCYANLPLKVRITQTEGSLEICELRDDRCSPAPAFNSGSNLFWSAPSEAEFRTLVPPAGPAIFPGTAKGRLEGGIRNQPNGDLRVEKVLWEKGLMLYLFPFYDEDRAHYLLERIDPERASANAD